MARGHSDRSGTRARALPSLVRGAMLFVWDGLSANLATVIVVMVALLTLAGMLFVALALALREVRRSRRLVAENATYRAMVEALPD